MKKTLLFSVLIFNVTYPENIDHDAFNKKFFEYVYEHNSWGSSESRSGSGSTLRETEIIRVLIPEIIKQLNIKTMLDAGCGDFNWMRTIDLSSLDSYIGADIVPALIEANQEQYGTRNRQFRTLDIVNDPIPKVDLILCRDCLQHLPDESVFKALNNIKQSGSTYLLTSNYTHIEKNEDIAPDDIFKTYRITYRNYLHAPFNFPKPILAYEEKHSKKVITLWRIADLPSSY